MAEYYPKFTPGQAVTLLATNAITGGRLVTTSGVVAPANAPNVVGVAGQDVLAGDAVVFFRDGVHRLLVSATVNAGDLLKAGANGTVVPYVVGTDAIGLLVGRALTAAASGGVVDAVLPFI